MVALGLTLDAVRAEFESRLRPGEASPARRLRRSPAAKRAMRLAQRQAEEAGADRVDTEHVLLGVLQSGKGTGFDILTALGMTFEGTSEAIARHEGKKL